MKNYAGRFVVCLVVGVLIGCGEGQPRSDFPQESPEIGFAKGVKSDIMTLKQDAQSRDSGIEGLASSLEGMLEGMEYWEQEPLGEHQETYFQIRDGVKELHSMVNSNGSRSDIMAKIDELIALTEKLPGDVSQPNEP